MEREHGPVSKQIPLLPFPKPAFWCSVLSTRVYFKYFGMKVQKLGSCKDWANGGGVFVSSLLPSCLPSFLVCCFNFCIYNHTYHYIHIIYIYIYSIHMYIMMSMYIYTHTIAYLILLILQQKWSSKKKSVFWHLSHPKVVFMWICPSTVWSPKPKKTNQPMLKMIALHPNITVGETPPFSAATISNLPNNQLLHAMKLFAGYGCSVSTTWPSLMPCSFEFRGTGDK